jgi:acetoin utilization deacetylase AcuC-like enzyme
MSHVSSSVLVLAQLTPGSIQIDENLDLPLLSAEDEESDNLDPFNKPRLRRALILKALDGISDKRIEFRIPPEPKESIVDIYSKTHSEGLLQFLTTAWIRWEELSVYGHIQGSEILGSGNRSGIQPFRSINGALPRDPYQRPSQSVMGAIGYYCSDQCTPITKSLQEELLGDSAVLQAAVDKSMEGMIVYAIPTHPGHHASKDCFGGYCYLNQAAFAARRFQMQHNVSKVAILDIGK